MNNKGIDHLQCMLHDVAQKRLKKELRELEEQLMAALVRFRFGSSYAEQQVHTVSLGDDWFNNATLDGQPFKGRLFIGIKALLAYAHQAYVEVRLHEIQNDIAKEIEHRLDLLPKE